MRRRIDRGRGRRRGLKLGWVELEALEERVVLSFGVSGVLLESARVVAGGAGAGSSARQRPIDAAVRQFQSRSASGVDHATGASGVQTAAPGAVVERDGAGPSAHPGPVGYTPQQLRAAYGLNQISFAGVKGDGSGQTIVIIDAYDNPSFVNSTDPNFSSSALHVFDQTFGLPDPPSFKKVNQNGDAGPLPQAAGVSGWGLEIALDVEWAHAMAPAASIILVEANDPDASLNVAELTAGRLGSVVSMSYGWSNPNEAPDELNYDANYNHSGVTFLAATGDGGAPSSYAAYSPYVVAVGGTSLQGLDAQGTYPGTGPDGEVGWSGSGGGLSRYEPEPSWQRSVQTSGRRSAPDVSADADPATGVGVYDPYDFSVVAPWGQVGGTSLSTPMMAGMIAIADEGRVVDGGSAFSSTEALTALYGLNQTRPGDFHDILHGNNGYSARPGYDLVTGLGTPNGAALVPDLASYGLSGSPSLVSISVAPASSTLGQGLSERFTATGTFAGGATMDVTSSVSWASSNPSAATINGSGVASAAAVGQTSITATLLGVVSGAAALTVLPVVSIAVGPGNPYVPVLLSQQFTATATYSDGSTGDVTGSAAWGSSNPLVASIDAGGSATARSLGSSTITAALGGVTSPGDVLTAIAPSFVVNTTADEVDYKDGLTSLREAVLAANVYPGQAVTFDPNVFAGAQTIKLKLGPLELLNPSGTESIVGPAAGVTVDAGGKSRSFDVGPLVSASISGVTMTGGAAVRGAGLFAVDANVDLTDCAVDDGYAAYGGGLYLDFGSAALTRTTVSGNAAPATGGGVLGVRLRLTMTDCTVSGNATGGEGGGLYLYSGSANVTGGALYENAAGSAGGGMMTVGTQVSLKNCTVGGNTTAGAGGGLYFSSGSENLTGVAVVGNAASVFGGGLMAEGGKFSLLQSSVSGNSAGFVGGGLFLDCDPADLVGASVTGNSAGLSGGGLLNLGTLTLSQSDVSRNAVVGSYAAGGGLTNLGSAAVTDTTITDNAVNGYYAYGGGLQNLGSASLASCTVAGDSASGNGFSLGGGLFNAGELSLTSVAVLGDSASGGFGPRGGGVFNSGASTLAACTIGGDSASQGGGLFNLGASTLYQCTISGNTASRDGGGVFTMGSSLTYYYNGFLTYLYPGATSLTNCTVSGNTAGGNGGGLATSSVGTTAATNTTVVGNTAGGDGGGVYTTGYGFSAGYTQQNPDGSASTVWVFIPLQGETDLTNSTITGNAASGDGGGVATGGLGLTTAVGTSITRNSAVDGGGVAVDGGAYQVPDDPNPLAVVGAVELSNCNLLGNSASAQGGGGWNGVLGVTLVGRSNIAGNTADAGGGLANSGFLGVSGGTIQNNRAASQGGGLSTTGGEADLVGVTLSMNSVVSKGKALGGAVASEDGILSMARCLVQLNRAVGQQAYGGGVYALNSAVTLSQTMVAANTAQGSVDANGGGVYSEGGTLDLVAAMISGNSSTAGQNDLYRKP